MPTLRILAALLLALGAASAYAAAPTSLAAKPGLWQVTVRSAGDPILPVSVARMTPAQKARIQAEMAKPVTMKQCVTAAALQKGFDLADSPHSHCTRTILASSATAMSAHFDCKGAHVTSSGTFQVALVSPGAFRGTTDMSITMNNHTSARKSSVVGTWLSADCGHVKPGEPE